MKNTKFHTLLALLLMAGGMTMQAQEPQQFYSAPTNISLSKSMVFINDDEALVKIGKSVGGRYDYAWDEYLFLLIAVH